MAEEETRRSVSDSCGLVEKSGIQVVTHMSIALSIVLGVLSISIISTSNEYSIRIDRERNDLVNQAPMYYQNDKLNVMILSNLEKISFVLFLCGVTSLVATLFQFLVALILLCTLHKNGRGPSQFWSGVTCACILCFITSLVLLLSIDMTPYPYYTHEQIYILLLMMDIVFSMYSLWVIISII